MGSSTDERKFKHIAWRKTKCQCGCIVQYEGKTIISSHKTQDEAANTLRRAQGLKRTSQLSDMGDSVASRQRFVFVGGELPQAA